MNSKPRSLLVAVLVLATVGSAGLAWQQYRALKMLRDGSSASDDSNDLQLRLAEAERRAHDLENELAALRGSNETDVALPGDGVRPSPPPGDRNQSGPRDGQQRFTGFVNNFDKLMENPDFARIVNAEERAGLDGRYASLFKQLAASGALTPQQVETFKDLLVEKQNAARDTRLAARANGISDRGEIRKLTQNTQAEIDRQIQTQLGDTAYNHYKNYEQTQPQRAIVNQLSQRLSYSAAPLNDSQAQQLVQILANTANQTANAATSGGSGRGATRRTNNRISDDAVSQAQGVLNTPQLQALVAIQNRQKAQQQITEMLRASNQQKQAAGAANTTTPKAK